MDKKTLKRLLDEEAELVFDRFTDQDAWTLGSWMVEQARERGLPVAIDIERNSHRLFHYSFDGASENNAPWIAAKAAVLRTPIWQQAFTVLMGVAAAYWTIDRTWAVF